MDPAALVFLTLFTLVTVGLIVFSIWREGRAGPEPSRAASSGNEEQEQRTPWLLPVAWIGYGLALFLLVMDPSWPGWLTGAEVLRDPGCSPVIGAWFWERSGSLDPVTCLQLANTRLGWALVLSVVASISLLLRFRERELSA